MLRNQTYPFMRFAFSLAFFLLLFISSHTLQAGLPQALDTARFDWVCVTDGALTEAYAPLAEHRQGQGLLTLVLALDEVILWSPTGDDTTATLRWLAGLAVHQWGVQYLVLGGSHALLPSPIHRLESNYFDFESPTDAYYSCLDGQWDMDGDGLVAEWEDDAAEPAVHIMLGRLPADDLISVGNLVAKIISFEQRPEGSTDGALFVSSLMDPFWTPEDPYPNWALQMAMARRDFALSLRPTLRAGTLFQGDQLVDPLDDPLNPLALVDSLGARVHDFVYFQLNGINRAWELAQGFNIRATEFASLAGCGHSFLVTMISGDVANTRGPGILQSLLTMSNGGAAGVIAPTGVGYMVPHDQFQDLIWTRLMDGNCDRLGEAFSGARTAFLSEGLMNNSSAASTYWYFSLMGDPATLLRPLAGSPVSVPPAALAINLRAVPNPFNPDTSLRFEVTGPEGEGQKVLVEIFNLQGRRVATLLDTTLLPGPHEVPWNEGRTSGLYFARVTVAGCRETVKLTLVE